MPPQYSNDYLMQTLHFTPEDLAANRNGILTEAQKERVRQRIGKGQSQVIIAVLVVLLLSGGIGAFMVFNNPEMRQSIEQNPTIVALGLGGSLLLYLVIVAIALIGSQRAKSGNFKVASIAGPVKLSSSEMHYMEDRAIASIAGVGTGIYTIQIGRTKMVTDQATFEAFENGQAYRLYYVGNKRAPIVIAAEVGS